MTSRAPRCITGQWPQAYEVDQAFLKDFQRVSKPVRRGREMIDPLALEEPKSAKIRAVSYEAAIDQLFKRMLPKADITA